MYRQVSLLDLNGINTRYQARLNAYGIFTPMMSSSYKYPRSQGNAGVGLIILKSS